MHDVNRFLHRQYLVNNSRTPHYRIHCTPYTTSECSTYGQRKDYFRPSELLFCTPRLDHCARIGAVKSFLAGRARKTSIDVRSTKTARWYGRTSLIISFSARVRHLHIESNMTFPRVSGELRPTQVPIVVHWIVDHHTSIYRESHGKEAGLQAEEREKEYIKAKCILHRQLMSSVEYVVST